MKQGGSIEEYRFRSLLDHAVQYRALMGGVQLYGPPLSENLPQSNLLYGRFWHSRNDLFDSLKELWGYCRNHRGNHGLDHVHVYALDGREGTRKFHAYLWKPETGDAMLPLDYGRAIDPHNRAYSAFILRTLLEQKKAIKTSTVVKRALPLAQHHFGSGVSDETLGVLLHKALKVMIASEPLIYSKELINPRSPTGRYTTVEHLGIYDKDATWLL
ncbi:hypothetical protein [Pseudotabrizicola sp. 4114]|uniref:hypothetical protein n=1 Tax=Pseudotabrizicola sp. 4114 TaxID=2817731 RepID=UPI00285A9847|nr:hypothetical protein [Pseudorhodobacter sp. 4114]